MPVARRFLRSPIYRLQSRGVEVPPFSGSFFRFMAGGPSNTVAVGDGWGLPVWNPNPDTPLSSSPGSAGWFFPGYRQTYNAGGGNTTMRVRDLVQGPTLDYLIRSISNPVARNGLCSNYLRTATNPAARRDTALNVPARCWYFEYPGTSPKPALTGGIFVCTIERWKATGDLQEIKSGVPDGWIPSIGNFSLYQPWSLLYTGYQIIDFSGAGFTFWNGTRSFGLGSGRNAANPGWLAAYGDNAGWIIRAYWGNNVGLGNKRAWIVPDNGLYNQSTYVQFYNNSSGYSTPGAVPGGTANRVYIGGPTLGNNLSWAEGPQGCVMAVAAANPSNATVLNWFDAVMRALGETST